MTISIDRQQKVPRQVYEVLRDRIQTGELEPGESINERRLSEWLGVSRTPIREAIRNLADEGLIDIVPNVGTSVARVDPKRVSELCVIRMSLECAAVEEAALHFTVAAGRKLDRLIAEQEETIEAGDLKQNIILDSEFHSTIHALAHYPVMAEILQRTMGDILRVRHLSIKLPGRLREPIIEHQAIVTALRSGSPSKASRAMRVHLKLSIASVEKAMATSPTFLLAKPD